MERREFLKTTGLHGSVIAAAPALLAQENKPTHVSKIKIAQVGICHEHANRMDTLRKLSDDYEVVGVVDDRHSTAARYGGSNLKPYQGLKWMSLDELFELPGLQAVMIETANGDLVPTAIQCMEQGLAIAMDKPGGEDIALFKKLLEGCEERSLPFQIGYMLRTNPAIQFCQEAVRKGWLGNIFEIQAGMSHSYGGESYQRYLSAYHGGIMFNLGCHHVDWIVSMMGRPEKVISLLGSTARAAKGAKNNSMAVLQYPHAHAAIYACDLETDGIRNRRLKITGDQGTIELSPLERFDGQPLSLQLRLKEANERYEKGTHVVDFAIEGDRYEGQLREFARVIRGEIENPYTYAHDALVQEVHLAASGYLEWQ